jgi:hypothetical protein
MGSEGRLDGFRMLVAQTIPNKLGQKIEEQLPVTVRFVT